VTPQRLALYEALAEDTGHPTAEVLLARLRPRLSSLSPASVYRILESLEAEGLVRRVSTPGGVSRYDANIAPHQHLVCRVCGRIADVENDALAGLRLPASNPAGFTAEAFDIRIVGVCAPCRKKESQKA
jgi:Fur family peroxide stress response transcriptional regulator